MEVSKSIFRTSCDNSEQLTAPWTILAVFLSAFDVLSKIPPDAVLSRIAQTPSASPLVYLRPLLAKTTTDPNSRCLAMKCLLLLPAQLWTGASVQAGSSESSKRALTIEEREVGNIMGFMESSDTTLRLLVRINIVFSDLFFDVWFVDLQSA